MQNTKSVRLLNLKDSLKIHFVVFMICFELVRNLYRSLETLLHLPTRTLYCYPRNQQMSTARKTPLPLVYIGQVNSGETLTTATALPTRQPRAT